MADALVWGSMAALYGALGVAAYLLLQRSYLRLQWCMVTLSCCVTLRYVLLGTRLAIAWVTNVVDVFVGFFLNPGQFDQLPGMVELAGNPNSLLPGYTYHASWTRDLFVHFAQGTNSEKLYLHLHILGMTCALSLAFLHMQVLRPGTRSHHLAGRLSAVGGLVGNCCALVVGVTDWNVASYGGPWAALGWFWMAGTNVLPLCIGLRCVVRGDIKAHRQWMTRFYMSMWSDFVVFRLMVLALTPMFCGCQRCAILICIWLSPAIGILLGEIVVRSEDFATWASHYKILKR